MPTYQYKCSKCDHEFSLLTKIDSRDTPTKEKCPHCNHQDCVTRSVSVSQLIYNPSGQIKTTDNFNDRLIEIKKTKGVGNTINTRRSAI